MNRSIPDHVLQFGTAKRSRTRRLGSIVRTNRFTYLGGLVFAIGIPLMLRPLIGRSLHLQTFSYLPFDASMMVSVVCLFFAHTILRKVGILPLVDDKLLIIPAFLTSYCVGFTFVMLWYFKVNTYLVVTSFFFGIAWYYLIAITRVRLYSPRLAFVGGFPDDDELLYANVEWEALVTPSLPRDVVGIVFDGSKPISKAFEHMFSRAILRNLPIYEARKFREMLTGRVQLDAHPVDFFGQLLPSQPYLRVKRIIDTLIVIPAIVVAAPFMLLVALAIRLESPGAAIFRQERIGFRGQRFTCYKFRSMRNDSAGPAFTVDNDPRVTRLGRIIRQLRIDELPQLFNILKGEMSWIGPRPEALSLARGYLRDIPHYACRHSVHPGITGWAAIHQGNVAQNDAVTRKLEYDFYYVKYFSVWLDLLIVLMTVRTVVTGFGSK